MTNRFIEIEIDLLTNSIENSITGEMFDTVIDLIDRTDIKNINPVEWLFDWRQELNMPNREVYKLTTVRNPNIIHGLLCIEDKYDHIFIHLIESASFNRGINKIYLGIAGNLFAFACKMSFKNGHRGYVAFDSKTVLIDHYKKKLGASHFKGQRMYIKTVHALRLVKTYFKE